MAPKHRHRHFDSQDIIVHVQHSRNSYSQQKQLPDAGPAPNTLDPRCVGYCMQLFLLLPAFMGRLNADSC